MASTHNFGSAVRIFLKFREVNGIKRYMEINYINGFSEKKNSFWAIEPFWAQMWSILVTLDLL